MNIKYYGNGDVYEENIETEEGIVKITYHLKHKMNEIIYTRDNRYHRDNDKPAYLKFDLNGNIMIKIYYTHGKCNRANNKPAYIKYQHKCIFEVKYYMNGNIMRTDGGPTHIIYYKKSLQPECIKYKSHLYFKYASHNSNLPMNIIVDNYLIHSPTYIDPNGNLVMKPGMIRYNKDGTINIELYFHKGKIHRYPEIGPAKILYLPELVLKSFFVNDRIIENKEDWIKNWSKMFASNIA